jgi:hypothetical protein
LFQNLLKRVRLARRLEIGLTFFSKPGRRRGLRFVGHSRFDDRQKFVLKGTAMQPRSLTQPVDEMIRKIFDRQIYRHV